MKKEALLFFTQKLRETQLDFAVLTLAYSKNRLKIVKISVKKGYSFKK